MTRRESILTAVAARLQAVPGAAVYRSRKERFNKDEGIGIVVTWDEDQPENRAGGGPMGLTVWNFGFMAIVIARADESTDATRAADQVADPIVESIHALLFADTTLGGLAATLIAGPAKAIFADSDGTSVEVEMRFTARYQTNANSLS